MRLTKLTLTTISLIFFGFIYATFSQTPGSSVKPSVITGDVKSIDAGKIVLNTKDGTVDVILSEKTAY
ncbi:MAG: hypothetical protein ACRD43_02690, partial [Pyrinomonadaceae bacterium]